MSSAREMFGKYRIAANAPTRNIDERPEKMDLNFVGSRDEIIQKAYIRDEFPILTFALPHFPYSFIQLGKPFTNHWDIGLWFFCSKRPGATGAEWPSPNFSSDYRFRIRPFFKLLCKIAHSYAVAEYGLNSHSWLLPHLILGKSTDFANFVGSDPPRKIKKPNTVGLIKQEDSTKMEHKIGSQKLHTINGVFLTVNIQLISPSAVFYRVVVAKTEDALPNIRVKS